MNYPFQNNALTLKERFTDLVSRLTVDEKIGLISSHQLSVERLGVATHFIGVEIARGYVDRDGDRRSSVFPQPIGMAGMFDTDLMYEIGKAAGTETRAHHNAFPKSGLIPWGPTVDLVHDPRWGRNEECYGEDPFLSGTMASAYCKGLSAETDGVPMTYPVLKHFCANSNEEGRINSSSDVYPQTLNEYYYEPFRKVITDKSAYGIMTAYNELSGVPAMVFPEIKNKVKREWGGEFVVTDGGDFSQNVTAHGYSRDHAEALAQAIKAGVDIMTDNEKLVGKAAHEALSRNLLTEKELDEAVYNSLLPRFKLGEFDSAEENPYKALTPNIAESEKHKRLVLTAALKQVVLLKNDGALPLDKKVIKKIAVIGDVGGNNYNDWYTGTSFGETTILDGIKAEFSASDVSYDDGHDRVAIKSRLNGKYLSADKNGALTASADVIGSNNNFIKADWGEGNYTYKSAENGKLFNDESMGMTSETTFEWFSRETVRPEKYGDFLAYQTFFGEHIYVKADGTIGKYRLCGARDEKLFTEETLSCGAERAGEAAAHSDAAIVCVGNDPMITARECFDRKTLKLPENQQKMLEAAVGANRNTIAVIVSSYPYELGGLEKKLKAIIYTTHAGPELGNALAKVLGGEYNPAGRLSQTWYSSSDELPSITEYDIVKNRMTYLYYDRKPLFCFGHGLSYSRFEYGDISLSETDEHLRLEFMLKNASSQSGEEVCQLYFRKTDCTKNRPLKKLCAFARVSLEAGESKKITLTVNKNDLRFYDPVSDKLSVESGEYEFMLGASSCDIRQSMAISLSGDGAPDKTRSASNPINAICFTDKENSEMKFSRAENRHYMGGGKLFYGKISLDGSNCFAYRAAAGAEGGKIMLLIDDKELAEIAVEATVYPDVFPPDEERIPALSGCGELSMILQNVGLLEFEFLKK